MAIKNYNSFPESGELLLRENGEIVEIRARQEIQDIWKNEKELI
jgi:diaminopimelate decarboxylase